MISRVIPGHEMIACKALACFLLGLPTSSSNAATHFVNVASTTGANDGTSWENAFQGSMGLVDALAAAVDGDQIWVAEGVYVPGAPGDIQSSFTLTNGVALFGGFASGETALNQRSITTHQTILSGDVGFDDVYGNPVWYFGWNINTPNSIHVVDASGAGPAAVLDGFTITAGRATQSAGGGVYNNGGSPTIANCRFWRNLAAFGNGGGIYNNDASLTVQNCSFEQNWVHLGQGAGIFNAGSSSVTVVDCSFSENRCTGATPEAAGGAICHYANGELIVDRCAFNFNIAESFYASGSTSGGYGGAVFQLFGTMLITNSTFQGNRSNAGGAVFTFSTAVIANCIMRNNLAPEYQAQQGGWGGSGGGVGAVSYHNDTVSIINCTMTGNQAKRGGGIRFLSGVTDDIANCILWGNIDEYGSIGPSQISGARARYCDIQNLLVGIPGEDPPDPKHFPNCIDLNPSFVDLAAGELHLNAGSPCIDAGENAAVPAGLGSDLDGLPRIVDGNGDTSQIVDMGAYEFQVINACPADIAPGNGDGSVGVPDLLLIINSWGPCAGCPADLTGDDTVGVPDLLTCINGWGPC